MKTIFKIFTVVCCISMFSCVDKKENNEVDVNIEKIETTETKIDSISVKVEENTEALETALENLENK